MHRVVEEILEDNQWRDGDFAQFKINLLDIDQTLWNRMCVPMIYAHWEGFVVSSLKILITYLNTLELHSSTLPTNLIVVCLENSYKSLGGKQSFKQRIEFTDRFKITLDETIKFSSKVDTKSNLRSNVLEEICFMFGFDYGNFDNVVTDLDRLVNVRNSIAHGENAIVPSDDNITRYIKSTREAMDIFLEEIELFIVNKSYELDNSAIEAV